MDFLSLFSSKPKPARSELQFGELSVELVQKKVKNLRLSVHPPHGRVRVSAPHTMSLSAIRGFIADRLGWIQTQQIKLRALAHEPEHEFKAGERHYFNGKAYRLALSEHPGAAKVSLDGEALVLQVRARSTREKRQRVLNEWYRAQLKLALPEIIEKYETLMAVKVAEFGVKRMKTRWGTCNPRAQRIWLSLELAKKSAACLEYVVVHEMTHLLERSHNQRFVKLMDDFLPDWRRCKAELNQPAINHQR